MVTTQSRPAMACPTPTLTATASFTDQPTVILSCACDRPLSMVSVLGVPG